MDQSRGRPRGANADAVPPGAGELSMLARLAVALGTFERVCRRFGLAEDPDVRQFLDYLWEFPVALQTSDAFDDWERRQPEGLVDVGLGGDLPPRWRERLRAASLPPEAFRALVASTTEIAFGSLYAAADDRESLADLGTVLQIARGLGVAPPDLTPFARSRFADGGGWGAVVTPAERDAWRAAAS